MSSTKKTPPTKHGDLLRQRLRDESKLETNLAAEIRDIEAELKQTKIANEDIAGEIKQYKDLINQHLNSRSWKIALPVRVVTKASDKLDDLMQAKLNVSLRRKSAYGRRSKMDPLELLYSSKPKQLGLLKSRYSKSELHTKPDTFILYRIIGNDLYPRHAKGQSRTNLQFIIDHEPEFKDCEKRFVVNRIIDPVEEAAIIDLLKQHGYKFIHIPFEKEAYRKIGLDTTCLPSPAYLASKEYSQLTTKDKDSVMAAVYRLKNNYIMNNNGARNAALRDGKKRAKWVLPWDGNCYVTATAWDQIRHDVTSAPYFRYFITPMARMLDNGHLLSGESLPRALEEPQILFRCDSEEEFNEEYPYGRRPKVELFWRLGVPGKWDSWYRLPWDPPRPSVSKEASQFGVAGWVARMFSGVKTLETDTLQNRALQQRGEARNQGIISTIRYADSLIHEQPSNQLFSHRLDILEKELTRYKKDSSGSLSATIKSLLNDAENALTHELYSVTDKTTLPPSGDKHDYWHPAPYWWPNPHSRDGLPYIWRDGQRVPGTRLFEADSEKYDRSRLQSVFDDSIILALAWKFSGKKEYAKRVGEIMERFFIDPETRMNPSLNYSQVKLGHNNNQGSSHGIIEMKDLYYYLDAVKLVEEAGFVTPALAESFKQWLHEYLQWLLTSPLAVQERSSANNHGTYYDIQILAISDFLEERDIFFDGLARCQSRISQQIAPDGSQPEELARTITLHYCCFNLQGWLLLTNLASRWDIDLWNYTAPNGGNIQQAVKWLRAQDIAHWPYKQIEEFDNDRVKPLFYSAESIEKPSISQDNKYQVKPKFNPHDGIMPYWNLG